MEAKDFSLIPSVTTLIQEAKKIIVLTGAGISTDSGIPDFRSKAGLFGQVGSDILTRTAFFKKPERFYNFVLEKMYFPDAKPNAGHDIIAKWEQEGRVFQVVTQNVDGLHQAAGSLKVIEFHGSLQSCYCRNCKKEYPISEMNARRKIIEKYYYCDACEGEENKRFIKTRMVLYEEVGAWFTENRFSEIKDMVGEADLILILGTKVSVSPFKKLTDSRNMETKTPFVIINRGDTTCDNKPYAYTINEGISETLTMIDQRLSR